MDKIIINSNISLELLQASHSAGLFSLIDDNRLYLRKWLDFLDNMNTETAAQNFIAGCMQRNLAGKEWAYLILNNSKAIGRVGLYKIDHEQKNAEIGYWIAEAEQGKGVITACCETIIAFAFNNLQMQRVELRCVTDNVASINVAKKLGFTHEATLRQAENLYGKFNDLHVFALLRANFETKNNT
jgi:ribosomal-protein-serine acetyltransferase